MDVLIHVVVARRQARPARAAARVTSGIMDGAAVAIASIVHPFMTV